VDKLLALRKEINEKAEPMDKVSVTDMMIKLICAAVLSVPEINSLFDGEQIKVIKDVNLAVAIALNNGLVVPVIKKADQKSLKTISAELKDLAFRAKNGTLAGADMRGGTLTLSNLGGYGSVDTFTPIIDSPQVAIIGLGRSRLIPIVANKEITVGNVVSISVTHDHRVLDGSPVAVFMASLIALINDPMKGLF